MLVGAAKVGREIDRDEMNKGYWVQNTPETQRIGNKYIRSHEGAIMCQNN